MTHVLPSFPPSIEHHSVPVTPATALSLLSTYLTAAESTPHLHPDSRLTPAGATFSASSGPTGNIVLSNLRRIAQGLAGENLAPSAEGLLEISRQASYRDSRTDDHIAAQADGDDDDGALLRKFRTGTGLDGIGNSRDRGLVGTDGQQRRGVLKKISSGEEGPADVSEEKMLRDELNAGPDGQAQQDQDQGWVDAEEFAESRDVLEGEVGERAGAPVVRQQGDGEAPEVLETGKRTLSAADKEARKEEKKKRRKLEKKEKARNKS